MQYSTALSDGILALACLACVIAIGRARRHYTEADQPVLFCALLGFLMPAAAAAAGTVRYALNPDWLEAHLWLSQASTFLALPLLGLTALVLGRSWVWSRPNWGRVILGLCVFFEVFRQMNVLDDYRLLLSVGALLLILYAGIVQWPRRLPALAGLAAVGLFLVAGLAVGTEGFIGPMRRVDLFHALLTLAYPLIAWLLLTLPASNTTENAVKTL
ncbi:MAG: hypothetical protein ACN6O6_22265 [Pseudomonas sp.]|uniref:DUF6962 family protein n=1 Tax=Pseudomonas sp. TaxID=306 RepID=UPI003D10A482